MPEYLLAGVCLDNAMSRLSIYLLIAVVPSMISHAAIYPRQDVSGVGPVLSTTTSSFNWWPYPAGGVTTSTLSSPLTLVPLTPTSLSSSSAAPITSSPKPTTSSHSSTVSHIHTTVSGSPSVPSPLPNPQSFLRPVLSPHISLWLVPVCLLSGAIIGCAVGWLAWRHCGEKRENMAVGHLPNGYAWRYKRETEGERDVHDNDVEYGYGREYFSAENGPAYHLEQGTRRMPSTTSTSGLQTWVGQTRKRSGVVRISTGNDQEHDNNNDVRSPLLTQAFSSKVLRDSKPLPMFPLPSSSFDGHNEDGDVPYENTRHKNFRWRMWERLGFAAEGDLAKQNKSHEGGRSHTWSAGATQEHGGDVGRSLSFWGRRKTMKEGRVERWVRGVVGSDEGDMQAEPTHQHEAPMEPILIECRETSPHLGTPELVLSTLRRVSPSVWRSPDSDGDLSTALGFSGKSPKPSPSPSGRLNPIVVAHSATTQPIQRRSFRHVERRVRGVSLQDPVSGSGSVSRRTIARTSSTSKNTFPLRSATISRSKHSPGSTSSPTPPSPSSVSRYSSTPHAPAMSTLNRSPTRTPTRSKASRELYAPLTRASPPSRSVRPVSTVSPPRRSSNTPPRTYPSPGRGVHIRPPSQQSLTSELPAGPSAVLSPLQSVLCFDETPGPLRAPTASGTKLPMSSSHVHKHSAKRFSASGSTGSTPNFRTSATHTRSSYYPAEHTPMSVSLPRPFSPKERYLARRNANARVGMILSRSYSSRNFEERPVSPTLFGAVINEELEIGRSEEGDNEPRGSLTFLAEGGEGIEQRLDKWRKN